MRRCVVVLVACGSAAKPTAPPTPPAEPPPPSLIPTYAIVNTFAPRPTIDLTPYAKPDLAADERWPLSMGSHPELEPHFDVAGALAQPGITWTDLCSRQIQNRHLSRDQDLVEYLKAWCAAAHHDASAALYQLGKLRSSPVRGVREALFYDAVDILADHGSADDVENLLLHAGLLELEIVDRLAAAYLEAGRLPDAYDMNVLATHLDRQPSEANACRRLVRAMAMGTDDQRSDAHLQFGAIVAPTKFGQQPTSDSTCLRMWSALECERQGACTLYWRDVAKLSYRQLAIISAYDFWPEKPSTADRWLAVARNAQRAVPDDDAYRLAIPALELALRGSRCLATTLVAISKLVDELAAFPHHDPKFDARLKALAAVAEQLDHATRGQCQQQVDALPPVTTP